jgi:hypothetical protein
VNGKAAAPPTKPINSRRFILHSEWQEALIVQSRLF